MPDCPTSDEAEFNPSLCQRCKLSSPTPACATRTLRPNLVGRSTLGSLHRCSVAVAVKLDRYLKCKHRNERESDVSQNGGQCDQNIERSGEGAGRGDSAGIRALAAQLCTPFWLRLQVEEGASSNSTVRRTPVWRTTKKDAGRFSLASSRPLQLLRYS